MKKPLSERREFVILVIVLLIASALVYLPRLNQIGYLNDDWYLMYSAHAYGPQVFSDIFSVDRPARAFVLAPAYNLFGDNPLYYNISAYFFRLVAGICFLWLLRMLWPQHDRATWIAALLFLIYPGFLSQFNGIDYQSQLLSLALAMVSIALSLTALLTPNALMKGGLFLISILAGWFYLGLVEYFLGLEVLRLAAMYILASRGAHSLKGKFTSGVQGALPGLFIPVIFLIWRIFFFESERSATNIGFQLEQFREVPLATGIWWLVRLVSNGFEVVFLAWGIPLHQFLAQMSRIRDVLLALLVSGILLLWLFWFLKPPENEQTTVGQQPDWRTEAMFLGFLTALAGLVPVILVNRQADFGDFSRYTLASSAGSALVMVAILFFLSSRVVRMGILSLLVVAAVFSHHANAIRLVNDTNSLRAFWWQVSWRIPKLKEGTTLVANYPITTIQEDYFVWGPANLIYYPEGIPGERVRTPISAAVVNKDTLLKIVANHKPEFDNRRSIRSVVDYQNILILSMPTQNSCVQVIDGNEPELSQFEEERIMVIAPFSDTGLIDLASDPSFPPQVVFGSEPSHDWCYYYTKADLARQGENWNEVVRLGNEALERDLAPQDDIEWMPFLQAYAHAGDVDRLDEIRRMMKNAEPFVTLQVCQKLNAMSGLRPGVLKVANTFCAS